MKHILLALFLLLASIGGAKAQSGQCPLTIAPKIVSSASYTVNTTDYCWWIILTNAGPVTVNLPAPGLIFPPGWYTTVVALNGGTVTLTGIADDAGNLHKINQQTTATLAPGAGALLKIQEDMNWWALPTGTTGTSGGAVTSVTFTGDGTVLSATPTAPVTSSGTLAATLNTQAAKFVLAGPVSGPNAAPTFRQLACADLLNSGAGCSSGGTVSSVGLSVPTASIFGVTGSPVTTTGTLGLTTAGTSGGIPYFSSTSQLASSAALTANAPVIGGGAGAAPTVGGRSGNTTTFATTSGALTNAHLAIFDVSGNIVDGGVAPGSSGCTSGVSAGFVCYSTGSGTTGDANNVWDATNGTLTLKSTLANVNVNQRHSLLAIGSDVNATGAIHVKQTAAGLETGWIGAIDNGTTKSGMYLDANSSNTGLENQLVMVQHTCGGGGGACNFTVNSDHLNETSAMEVTQPTLGSWMIGGQNGGGTRAGFWLDAGGNGVFRARTALDGFGADHVFITTNGLSYINGGATMFGATALTGSNGEIGLAKITASGTAPGAGAIKLSAVAGTNAGTCKLIAYAGTSTTALTVLDNIGAGC